MNRWVFAVVFCTWAAGPVHAQERGDAPRLNISRVTFDVSRADSSHAARQAATAAQPSPGRSTAETTAYVVTLATAVGGTIYTISTTREALDRKLEARTFPAVWWKTSNPKDKNKMSAVIGGANGALMVIGAFAFREHSTRSAILLNAIVTGIGLGVGLHNRSVINDDKQRCPTLCGR